MIKCFLYLNGRETKSRYASLPAVPTAGAFINVNNGLEQQIYKVISAEFIDSSESVNLNVQKVSNVPKRIN